jgi:hypothetical protein
MNELQEIDKVHAIFLEHKDNPPVTKNQPPVAGPSALTVRSDCPL